MRINRSYPGQSGRLGRKAFSLVEMIAVLWGLGILTVLGVVILAGVYKVHHFAEATHADLNRFETFVDQFRSDVAHASAAPASLDKWKAGPGCLLLRYPDGSHIVYIEMDGEWKRIRGPKGETSSLYPGTFDLKLEFTRSGPEGRLLTMHLTSSPFHNAIKRETLEIVAAIGADLR